MIQFSAINEEPKVVRISQTLFFFFNNPSRLLAATIW